MSKEKAMVLVEQFKALGGAFVEDEFVITDGGEEVYNPTVDRENAELWLLDNLMKL